MPLHDPLSVACMKAQRVMSAEDSSSVCRALANAWDRVRSPREAATA